MPQGIYFNGASSRNESNSKDLLSVEQKNYCSSTVQELSRKITDIFWNSLSYEASVSGSGRAESRGDRCKFYRNSECTRETKNKHGGHNGRSQAILR